MEFHSHANGKDKASITFKAYLAINEYGGLAMARLAGTGIGDLPPIVQPVTFANRRLVEVMPKSRFRLSTFSRHASWEIVSSPDPFVSSRILPPRWRLLLLPSPPGVGSLF